MNGWGEMSLFADRIEAGKRLAKIISVPASRHPLVLGIPRGGVAVGKPVAEKLACPLEPITVRKLPTPGNDQMGFGAVTLDREVLLNPELVDAGYVSRDEIDPIVDKVYREVMRRDRVYRGKRPFPALEGRCVVIADDGLATGYTMLAAIRLARKKGAAEIIAAVPVAHAEAYEHVADEADVVYCLHIDRGMSFAVAAFYRSFPDMNDREVKELLVRTKGEKVTVL